MQLISKLQTDYTAHCVGIFRYLLSIIMRLFKDFFQILVEIIIIEGKNYHDSLTL